jgi:hypothetical protein
MKKLLVLVMTVCAVSFAAKGGVEPLLATCCLGSRVGLEMNEGRKIRTMEWLRLVPFVSSLVMIYEPCQAYTGKTMSQVAATEGLGGVNVKARKPAKAGGGKAFLTACCLGPRVGYESNEGRKIREKEWMVYIPVYGIVPLVVMLNEAYVGKTMSQITAAEGLDR